ncbi:MAG: 4Fe-4S binding protein [Lachnospiraceae bacterium]|nr:4Fe-4S binding protein [Lachnospiraceae bacterium]
MLRKIIKIDEEKCVGCGLCADACHEGAIGMVDGKAKLLREDYCDGLGDCLPACPVDAISFEMREAPAYDEAAVLKAKAEKEKRQKAQQMDVKVETQLLQWPVQIKLMPIQSAFYQGANLLIAADCCAYAYGNFHNDFMKNHITIIGCPKLDMGDYTEKLTQIIQNNDIKSVKIARMTVPCCGRLEQAAKRAIQNSGKFIPWGVVSITPDGEIKE